MSGGSFKDSMKDSLKGALGGLGDAEQIQEALRGAGEKLKEEFSRATEGVDVDALRGQAEAAAKDAADEAAAFVRKYPLQTALGVFGVGLLAGLWLGRRR